MSVAKKAQILTRWVLKPNDCRDENSMRKHFFKRSSEAESPTPLTKPEGIQFEMLSWGWEVRSPSDFIEEDKQHRNGMMVSEQESEPEEKSEML